MKERYKQVQSLAGKHRVSTLCSLFGVSRSGYYQWRHRGPSHRQRVDDRLLPILKELFETYHGIYGRPRLTAELHQRGHKQYGHRRVGRLMRLNGLQARIKRSFKPQTTDSRHDNPIAQNLLGKRTAPPDRFDEVWVTDLTYISTAEGWLYMAAVMDLYSRRIVGWAFGPRITAALAMSALQMALTHRTPKKGLLHHSDRGSQYASARYRQQLEENGLKASMSRKANPYDNAFMESFFSTLKIECVHRCQFSSREEGQAEVFEYVETFYNRVRIHSALGYKNPVNFENQLN